MLKGPSSRTDSSPSKGKDLATAVCTAARCGVKSSEASIQAIFLISTLAAIEGVKQQSEIAGLRKESLSASQLTTAASESTKHLLASSEFQAGILTMIMTKPVSDVVGAVILNTQLQPLLKEFISKSAAGMVGFVGYEAGAELLGRAIQMIPDADERKRAEQLGLNFLSAISSDKNMSQTSDAKVLAKVKENVFEILVNDEQLREKWWSFVLRNRVQTGDFAIGISLMSAGGMLGEKVATCMPSGWQKTALPVLGMVTGVLSGVAVSFLPHQSKDAVTKSFQALRMKFFEEQLNTSKINLSELLKRFENERRQLAFFKGDTSELNEKMKKLLILINEELAKMDQIKEGYLTSFFDLIHLLNTRMLAIENKIQIAAESGNGQAEESLKKELAEYKAAYKQSKAKLEEFVSADVNFMSAQSQRKLTSQLNEMLDLRKVQAGHLKKSSLLFVDQIEATAIWGNGKKNISPAEEAENQRLLEKAYLWGFKTQPFLDTINFNQ